MKIRCPNANCGTENEVPVMVCLGCGTDLRAYAIALKFNDLCFNNALQLAGAGDHAAALREIEVCLKFKPGDDEAALLSGKINWAIDNKKTARQIWDYLVSNSSDADTRQQASMCLEFSRPKKQTPGNARNKKKKKKKRR